MRLCIDCKFCGLNKIDDIGTTFDASDFFCTRKQICPVVGFVSNNKWRSETWNCQMERLQGKCGIGAAYWEKKNDATN